MPQVGAFSGGEDIALIHAASEQGWERAEARFLQSLLWDGDQNQPSVILEQLCENDQGPSTSLSSTFVPW